MKIGVFLFCILFTTRTLFAVPLAEKWVVNVKRLTNDNIDNNLKSVEIYNDTVSFTFGDDSGGGYYAGNELSFGTIIVNNDLTVNVNTKYHTPRSTLNLPGMNFNVLMEYDDSVDIYQANGNAYGDVYVKTDTGIQQLNRTGLGETCRILAVSNGVAVYQNDDGVNFVWRDGESYQLPSDEPNEVSTVIGVENGIVAYTQHYGQALLWQWQEPTEEDPTPQLTTALATANSYEAETIIGMKDGVVVFGDQDGNAYVWQNGDQEGLDTGDPYDNEYITGMAGGIVTFSDDDGNAYAWQNGESYVLTSGVNLDETVVAIENGIVAYTDENGESYLWHLEDDGEGGFDPVISAVITMPDEPETIVAMKNGLAVIETADKQAYVWKDGATHAISATVYKDENIIGIGDGVVAIEDSQGYAWVWTEENGTTALSSGDPYNTERIIGVDGKIVVFETADSQAYVWHDGETDSLNGIPYQKDQVVAFHYGMVAFQDEDGNSYVWRDGSQYPLPSAYGYGEVLVVGVIEDMIVYKDEYGELYVWQYDTETDATTITNIPGHYGYPEQIVDVAEDGRVIWKENYNNETNVYIWQDGENKLIDHGDNFQSSGFIDGTFYYTMDTNEDAEVKTNLYKYSDIDEDTIKIDEDVDYVNASLDGRIYYNKYVEENGDDRYEKWALYNNATPMRVNDMVYSEVHAESDLPGYEPDEANNTLVAESNYNGSTEIIDEFTSDIDYVTVTSGEASWDVGSFWQHTDHPYSLYGYYETDSDTPKLDRVTNEVAWDVSYAPYNYEDEQYAQNTHSSKTVYWSHNDEDITTPVDNDSSDDLPEAQYRPLFANKGVLVTVGYTSESLTEWPYYFQQRLNDTEYIHFNDGSTMPVSIFYDQLFAATGSDFTVSSSAAYWGGLRADIDSFWEFNEQHFGMLFEGVYAGETDTEYIMVWLNELEAYTGTPEPEIPPISIPEPTTLFLSFVGCALGLLRNAWRK